jgi:hypothetical protein
VRKIKGNQLLKNVKEMVERTRGEKPPSKEFNSLHFVFCFFLSSFLNLNEFKSMKHTTTTAADVKVVV